MPKNSDPGARLPRNSDPGARLPKNSDPGALLPRNSEPGTRFAAGPDRLPRNSEPGILLPTNSDPGLLFCHIPDLSQPLMKSCRDSRVSNCKGSTESGSAEKTNITNCNYTLKSNFTLCEHQQSTSYSPLYQKKSGGGVNPKMTKSDRGEGD